MKNIFINNIHYAINDNLLSPYFHCLKKTMQEKLNLKDIQENLKLTQIDIEENDNLKEKLNQLLINKQYHIFKENNQFKIGIELEQQVINYFQTNCLLKTKIHNQCLLLDNINSKSDFIDNFINNLDIDYIRNKFINVLQNEI